MTKVITATLVLDQVDQGALSLDDQVVSWLDASWAEQVTVRQLLNHTSGIPNYTEQPGFQYRYLVMAQKTWAPDELLDFVRQEELMFQPGTRHYYSNSNYIALGLILQHVTGRGIDELFVESIKRPLGQDNIFLLQWPEELDIVDGCEESVLGWGKRNVSRLRTGLVSGSSTAGGLVTQAEDLARIIDRLFAGDVLSPSSLQAMQEDVPAPDADVPLQTGYGLGLRVWDIDGERWVGHSGTILGYSGLAFHHPRRAPRSWC